MKTHVFSLVAFSLFFGCFLNLSARPPWERDKPGTLTAVPIALYDSENNRAITLADPGGKKGVCELAVVVHAYNREKKVFAGVIAVFVGDIPEGGQANISSGGNPKAPVSIFLICSDDRIRILVNPYTPL